MNMKEVDHMLEAEGWTLECESPLEIRHEDGSFATGQAARAVIESLAHREDTGSQAEALATLRRIYVESQAMRRRIQEATLAGKHMWKEWEILYGNVFEQMAPQVKNALKQLAVSFPDYCDPDASYREDVEAWLSAFYSLQEPLKTVFGFDIGQVE